MQQQIEQCGNIECALAEATRLFPKWPENDLYTEAQHILEFGMMPEHSCEAECPNCEALDASQVPGSICGDCYVAMKDNAIATPFAKNH